jgi:hypothetical protein
MKLSHGSARRIAIALQFCRPLVHSEGQLLTPHTLWNSKFSSLPVHDGPAVGRFSAGRGSVIETKVSSLVSNNRSLVVGGQDGLTR